MKIEWISGPDFAVPISDPHTNRFTLAFRNNIPESIRPTLLLQKETIPIEQDFADDTIYITFYNKADYQSDTELLYSLVDTDSGLNEKITVRYISCTLDFSLLQNDFETISIFDLPVFATMVNTLLFNAYRRYSEITFLKQITKGFSGAIVLVAQPRLLSDKEDEYELKSRWASPFVVKCAPWEEMSREYGNYLCYVSEIFTLSNGDMQYYMQVKGADTAEEDRSYGQPELYSTTVSTYISGDDNLQFQMFDDFIVNTEDPLPVVRGIENIVTLLDRWYIHCKTGRFDDYTEISEKIPAFIFLQNEEGLLRNKKREKKIKEAFAYRNRFKNRWKNSLVQKVLQKALKEEGSFSVIHGDLHSKNIFINKEAKAWLIDFEKTGIGPILYDFVTLELHLRTTLLEFVDFSPILDSTLIHVERELNNLLWGISINCDTIVREIGPVVKNSPESLSCIIQTIAAIRKKSIKYCIGGPSRPDYMAMLYLCSLKRMRWADDRKNNPYQSVRNMMHIAIEAEKVLAGRYLSMAEQIEYRKSIGNSGIETSFGFQFLHGKSHERLLYFFQKDYSAVYFPEIVQMKGVVQNLYHQYDVFDHTLGVIKNIEELFDSELIQIRNRTSETISPLLTEIITLACESGPIQTMIKWAALFHDSGKVEAWDLDSEGVIRMSGHENLSIIIIRNYFKRIKITKYDHESLITIIKILFNGKDVQPDDRMNEIIKVICAIIQNHHITMGPPPEVESRIKRKIASFFKEFLSEDDAATDETIPLYAKICSLVFALIHGFADIDSSKGPYYQGENGMDNFINYIKILDQGISDAMAKNAENLFDISSEIVITGEMPIEEKKEAAARKKAIVNELISKSLHNTDLFLKLTERENS